MGKSESGSNRVQLIILLVVILLLLVGIGAAWYFGSAHTAYVPPPDTSQQQVFNPTVAPPTVPSDTFAVPTPIVIVITAPPAPLVASPTPEIIIITAAAPPPATSPTPAAQPDGISVGDLVEVSLNGLLLHTQPSLDAAVVDNGLTRNDLLDVVGGPINVDGRNWWLAQERYDGGPQGWASAAGLQPVDPSVATILVGASVEVDYEQMKIHDAADLNASVIAVVPQGQRLQVVGGPVIVNGRPWWQVSDWDSSGSSGWVSNRYLRRVY